jgi:hypothetical protein
MKRKGADPHMKLYRSSKEEKEIESAIIDGRKL